MDERGATSLCDLLTVHDHAQPAEPSVAASPFFVVLRGNLPGEMITLDAGHRTIGRAPENDVQVADMSISRHHAALVIEHERLAWLTDLGSTNGTFLNGQRLAANQSVGLRDGDRVGLGPSVLLKFVRTDALDANHHREMFERSVRDPLTGLYNRAYFLNQMSFVVQQTYRRDLGLAIVMLDIDHFKRVNDSFGHEAGDEVLRHVAGVLRQSTRTSDLVARYGGEEFVAALPSTSVAHAWDRAERMRTSLKSRALDVNGLSLHVTGSFGVSFGSALFPRSIDRLIAGADQALYQAKDLGRDRVVLDTPADPPLRSLESDEVDLLSVDLGDRPGVTNGLTTVDYDAYRDA